MSKNGKQASAKPAAAEPVPEGGVDHVRAAFKSDGRGGGTLQLRYTGKLAGYDTVWVRLGERRHGKEWLETRDVRMERSDGQAAARIQFAPGEQVEGASFAFFAVRSGDQKPAWDNAGHELGCYVLDAQSGTVQAR